MKLLITRSAIPHFYRVDRGGELEELVPLDYNIEHAVNDVDLPVSILPLEISLRILTNLFFLHLHDFNFDAAASLITLSKVFATDIYRMIYGRTHQRSITTIVRRVSGTLETIACIHDQYMTALRPSTFTSCRIIIGSCKYYYPWAKVQDCYAEHISGPIEGEGEAVSQYEVGICNGDKVWLNGRYRKDGTFNCEKFRHPILSLEINDVFGDNVLTSDFIRKNRTLNRFIILLKLIYGPNTGIFFFFNDAFDPNPFNVGMTGFVEF